MKQNPPLMDNFHFFGFVDPTAMMAAIGSRENLWDLNRARTAAAHSPHREASDILLRSKGRDLPAMRAFSTPTQALLDELLFRVDVEDVVSVTIARLQPGLRIYHHIDHDFLPEPERPKLDRFQIMLQGSAMFNVGRESAGVVAGDIFWFDNAKLHGVVATGDVPRITLIVDLLLRDPMPRVPELPDDVLAKL